MSSVTQMQIGYYKHAFSSGYFSFVGGNLVTRRNKKQNDIACSAAGPEYQGTAQGICELLWLRVLLNEIAFSPKKVMELYYDNQAPRDIANNPVQHDRNVEANLHFIKEKLVEKLIDILFVNSEQQLADILTHAVTKKVFHDSLNKLGIGNI